MQDTAVSLIPWLPYLERRFVTFPIAQPLEIELEGGRVGGGGRKKKRFIMYTLHRTAVERTVQTHCCVVRLGTRERRRVPYR
jgi:hypothetical protein